MAILVGEFMAISLRYDAQGVSEDRALHELIAYTGAIARLGIVVGLITLMVIVPRCHGLLKQEADRLGNTSWFIPSIAGNLLAFPASIGSRPLFSKVSLQLFGSGIGGGLGDNGLATLVSGRWPCTGRALGGAVEAKWLGPGCGTGLERSAFMCGLLARDQWKTLP